MPLTMWISLPALVDYVFTENQRRIAFTDILLQSTITADLDGAVL